MHRKVPAGFGGRLRGKGPHPQGNGPSPRSLSCPEHTPADPVKDQVRTKIAYRTGRNFGLEQLAAEAAVLTIVLARLDANAAPSFI